MNKVYSCWMCGGMLMRTIETSRIYCTCGHIYDPDLISRSHIYGGEEREIRNPNAIKKAVSRGAYE